MPNHVRSAAKAEYRKLLGNPIEVNPLEAIMKCIHIRYGEVIWLSERIAELEEKNWVEATIQGRQFHLFVRERQAAMADLTRFSQIAISLGLTERAVKLAETYGELIARYTKTVIDGLWPYLSDEGRQKWPVVVRQALIAVDESAVVAKPKELEAA